MADCSLSVSATDIGGAVSDFLLLYAGGDTNLYAYVLADPVNGLDSFGLDALYDATNFFADVGDTLSAGITNSVRERMGTNDSIDFDSGNMPTGDDGTLICFPDQEGAESGEQ